MKELGLFFLALIPMAVGFWQGEELKKKAKVKKSLFLFFKTAEREIGHFKRDQKSIFFHFQDPFLEKIGFLPRLREEVERTPCLSLNRTVKEFLSVFSLSDAEREAVIEFSEHFGMQSHTSQLKDFEILLTVLKEEEEIFRKDLTEKIRLKRTLGITFGIGIYIFLI